MDKLWADGERRTSELVVCARSRSGRFGLSNLFSNDEAVDLLDRHLRLWDIGVRDVESQAVSFKHPLGGRCEPISDERFIGFQGIPNINHVPVSLPNQAGMHYKSGRWVIAHPELNLDLVGQLRRHTFGHDGLQ
jgi:hypothetical protein